MLLNSTLRKIQVVLGEAHTTNALPVVASYFDSAAVPGGGPSLINTNGVTAVDIVPAPAASTIRQVNEITVFNADTVAHGVTVRYNDNSTLYTIIKVTLLAGETLTYSKSLGWHTLDAAGNLKQSLGGTTANISNYTPLTNWTPADNSGAALSLTINYAKYVILDRVTTLLFNIAYPVTANGSLLAINGLPNIPAANIAGTISAVGMAAPKPLANFALTSGNINIYDSSLETRLTNAQVSGVTFSGCIVYPF